MKAITLHRLSTKQVQVPACMSAYWSQFSIKGNLGNDRTPEITIGFREGAGYA